MAEHEFKSHWFKVHLPPSSKNKVKMAQLIGEWTATIFLVPDFQNTEGSCQFKYGCKQRKSSGSRNKRFSQGTTSEGYQRDGPGRHDLEVGLARLPDPVGHGVADGLKPVHGDHHQHVRAESKIEWLSRRFSFSSIRRASRFEISVLTWVRLF